MPQNPIGAFVARKFTNAFGPAQLDQQGALWDSQRHGKYYAAAYGAPASAPGGQVAGSLFRGSNQTGATLSNALATTYTGLCLNNPAASGVNLAVKRVAGVLNVAPTAFIALGLITGWSAAGVVTHTTSLDADVVSAYVGAAASSGSVVGPASKAHLDAACTIVGTPLWDRWITASVMTADPCNFYVDIDDDLIIPPGGYVAIGASEAGPTSGLLGTFMWEELAP